MIEKKEKHPLVWIDMEMTGLDPEKEKILEIACLITDVHLNILAEGPNLVIHQPQTLLSKMDNWNKTQHKKSGLLELVKNSKLTAKKAEAETLRFLKQYCKAGKSPLCGNSVHHDRRFLIKYMPRVAKFLHYRIVDVSSVKYLIHGWYGKKNKPPKKEELHRALADIRESVDELRFYREHFFIRAHNQ